MPDFSWLRRFRLPLVTAGMTLGVMLCAAPGIALAQAPSTLRIGLAEDPDMLDPALARSFVGRVVMSSLCDKLFDIDAKSNIVPQLATSYKWAPDDLSVTLKLRDGVTFHDGEKFDAEAVKFNIDRDKTIPGSYRKGELSSVKSVDVLDPTTVRLNLTAPFAPLLTMLADRAGMMVAPKAAQTGSNFATHPVCSGPFSFVERVAQDRIVLQRYPNYWNKDAIHFDRIVFLPIVDGTVRLANLRSGQLDMIERLAPTDVPAAKSDGRLAVADVTGLGWQGLYINIRGGDQAQKNPLGRDPRVREALELAIDRQGLIQVAMNGEADVGNQWVPPSNTYYAKNVPVPKRNVEQARALLKQAGVTNPSFTLMVATTSEAQKMAQVIQAMGKEAGFDIKLQPTEFATALDLGDKGQFEAYLQEWSGRPDPDGNLFNFIGCKQPNNYSGYCNPKMDALLAQSRGEIDPAKRLQAYQQIAALMNQDRPMMFLFHRHWIWAYNKKLSGFKPLPDALIRPQGLRMQ